MKNVIVFGRGQYFHKKANMVKQHYNVEAFADNDTSEKMLGREWNEIPVISPKEIDKYPQCDVLVMVSWQLMNEVVRELIGLGISRDRILLGVNEEPSVNETEYWIHDNKAIIEVLENGELAINSSFGKYIFGNSKELSSILLTLYEKTDRNISLLKGLPVVNRIKTFGSNRGNPVDRYYIESFLEKNKDYIMGDVAEMGELTYTERFGHDLNKMYMLHLNRKGENILNINLETGEGIEDDILDCYICTQTIQFIYDLNSVVQNIHRMLKKDGVALITAAGISKISTGDYNSWGEYWHFTKQSMERLMKSVGFTEVEVESYGNVKTSIAFLYGLTVEDLLEDDFEYNDEQFQMIVTAFVRK